MWMCRKCNIKYADNVNTCIECGTNMDNVEMNKNITFIKKQSFKDKLFSKVDNKVAIIIVLLFLIFIFFITYNRIKNQENISEQNVNFTNIKKERKKFLSKPEQKKDIEELSKYGIKILGLITKFLSSSNQKKFFFLLRKGDRKTKEEYIEYNKLASSAVRKALKHGSKEEKAIAKTIIRINKKYKQNHKNIVDH